MDLRKIKKLMELLEESGIAEIEVKEGEESIKLSRNISSTTNMQVPQIIQQPTQTTQPPTNQQNSDMDTNTANNLKEGKRNTVNSPMVGTAYSAPEPGKEPFIKLNSSVSKGDTILIIEAMKVMNTITAHKSGKVVFIGFKDSQPVEFNELLVIIE